MTPVPAAVAGLSSSAPVLAGHGHRTTVTRVIHNGGPVKTTPHELFLTRAHSAVFNVKNLKSIVVKKERNEVEDMVAPAGTNNPKSLPAHLAKQQIVKNSTSAATPSADSSFDGLDYATWGAGHPPDENGDVGPNYYIQTVNSSIGIYDKSSGSRVAAFTFNTFMSQGHFGNLCDTNNYGDPVVLYDSYENRWLITDFAFTLDGSGNLNSLSYQCFAVSKTGDPVNGGWNYYSITNPSGQLGDYPKFGIWPDGIYMSANEFTGSSYTAYHAWALNKQQMYANAPTVSVVDFTGNGTDFTVIPANSKLAAGAPPAGSPEYFVSTENYLNAVSLYKFQVNWDKISTSTFTGPFLETAPNCWPNATPANASTPANAADPLSFRAMATPQYTNIGGQESVWVAHTVERGVSADSTCSPAAATGGNATVRWYQANVTGGTIASNVTQGSSFDPEGANTYFRFSPALAVDHLGDMGITYTKSSSTFNPSIMFDGRLSGDAANTLGTESTLMAGTGAQSGNCGSSTCIRWGDYAGMQLAPDGCEFWMTGEYYATSGLNDLTRIGSFHFPGCTPIGNGTLSGTVTDGANPISGATVTLGSRTTTTDANGNYAFTVPAGTYPSLLADYAGYNEGSASSLAVPDGGTLTQNFTLSTASTSNCLTDSTQSAFQRGVPTNCDLTGNPGVVQLAAPDNTAAQNVSITPAGFGISNTSWAGQTFTPTVSGKLKEVDVDLFCYACTAASPNITVSIRATSGTTPVPTGADLGTATITGFNDGASGGYHAAVFSTPVSVTAGTRYAFVFRLASAFSSGTMAYSCSCSTTGYSNSNPYANGQRVTSTNSGSSWTADTTVGGRDLGFVTYINPGYGSSGTFVSSLKDANPATGSAAHWTTLTYSATTPANTSVKFQIAGSNSQYGPWSYVGPDGTSSTYFTTSGADISQFNGYRYLRYEAFLGSTNTSATPTLNSVTLCFQDVGTAVASTLTPSAATGTYGGTTTLSATLTSGGNGVQGKSVSFSLNGTTVGSASTNANGVATLSNVSLAGINAGSYSSGVSASFAGDSGYLLSSGTSSLTVAKADQAIVVTTHAPSAAAVDDQFTVAATGGGSGNAVAYGSSGSCTNSGATYTVTSTGACTVTYDQAGNSNYNTAPELTDSVNSSKANQTIHVTTDAPASAVYGTQFTVAATGGKSGNPVTYGSSGGCTNSGATFTMTSGTSTCVVTYDQAGSANYNAATEVTENVTAQKADQTITVTTDAPSSAVYGTSFDVAASAATGTVAYTSSGLCSNTGSHFTMTGGTGSCTVHFNQAGDGNYNAAPEVTEPVTAQKATQSINFAPLGDHTYGDADFDPGATASSGYAVSYGASGNCTIAGGLVHITGAGSCTVTASQAGDSNYSAAPDAKQSFSIGQAPLTITANDREKTYGQALDLGTTAFTPFGLVGSDSVSSVTLASDGADASAHGGTYPIVPSAAGAGNGTDLGNYAITYANGTLTVDKVAQSVAFSPLNDRTYGDADVDPGATASSGLDVSYDASGACSIVSGMVHLTGAGACTVTASQGGNSDYAAATPVQHSFSIGTAALTITANDRQKTYGQALDLGTSAFTPSGLVGSDSVSAVTLSSDGAGASAHVGNYSIAASAAVAGNGTDLGNYSVTYVDGTLSVAKASQSITFAAIGDHTYGDGDFDPGASASSGLDVSYDASGNCSLVAGMVHITGAGSCTVTASQAGSSDYTAASPVQRTFLIGTASLTITANDQQKTYGDSLSLGTSAFTPSGLVGSDSISSVTLASYGAAAGAHAGNYAIVPSAAVAGNGTDLGNYAVSYVNGTLSVAKASQSITFAAIGDRTWGDSNFDPGATASSGLAVSYGTSGNCSIVSGKVHLTGAGSCTVTASQNGNGDYTAASPVQRTFSIGKASLTITANDRAKIYGFALDLGGSAFTVSGLVNGDSVSSVTLTSSGSAAGASAGSYAIVPSAAVGASNYTVHYVNGSLKVINAGLVGLNGVSITPLPGTVDSFDPSLGAYGGSNHGSAALALSNGDVAIGDVVLSGGVLSSQGSVRLTTKQSVVTGNVTAGGTVTNAGHINGTVAQNSPSLPVEAPAVAACKPYSGKSGISGGSFALSSGNLTVVSGTVTLANGTYCFHNVVVGTGAKLKVNGPVTINVTGIWSSGTGTIVNTTDVPANLRINSSYTGTNGVALAGGADAYMTVVAPGTGVTVAKGSFFGRIVGGTLKVSGKTKIHEDVH